MSESIASFRSGFSGFSGVGAGGELHNDGLEELAIAGDFNRIRSQIEDAMNEAFFAIQEFRLDEDWRLCCFAAFLEWAQLALFILDPVWGWGFRWDTGPWRWVRRLQLQVPVADQGHTFWTGVLFSIGGIIALIIGGSLFVATRRRTRKPPETFIMVLRVFCTIFLGVFNISAFSCLMMALACNWGRRGTVEGTLMFFPERKCISNGHAVPAAFALFVFIPLWMGLSCVYAVSSPVPSPRTKILSATPSSTQALKAFFLRSSYAAAYYVFAPGGQLKLLSLIFLGLSLALAANWAVNGSNFSIPYRAACTGGAGAVFFGSLVTVFRVHHENRWVHADSLALAVGAPLFGLASAALAFALSRRDVKAAQAILAETRAAQRIDPGITAAALRLDFQFGSPEQVHRAAAVIARGAPSGKPVPTEVTFAVEAAFLQGIRQFPEMAILHVLAARFAMGLSEAQAGPMDAPEGDAQRQIASVPASAVTQVERAKGLQPRWPERYLIFSADTELKELSQRDAASDESAMDLQGYVDFQSDFAKVLKGHRSALLVNRRFWRLLCKENISFHEMDAAFHDMQRYEALAEHSYRAALEKRPQNVKLLRAFARFIDDVLHDSFRAQQLRSEAEKRERAAEAKTRRNSAQGGGLDEKMDAVVVATAQGVIKIANKNLHKLFGYKKDELPGKNISLLMPAPYAQLHAGYVKRFLQTQKSTVLDMHRRLEGRHKTGKLIPITIRVTRIESAGEITFLGVLRAVQEDFAECVVAIEDGIMIEANDACAELFGYSSGKELLNHPVASLLQPEAEGDLRAALTIAASGEDVDHQFAGRHASGDGLPVSMQLEIGDDEASCIKIRFTSLAGSGLLTTDGMGNIRSCNQLMSRLFGYPTALLCKMNLTGLMPRPFSRFHPQYLSRFRDFKASGKGPSLNIVDNPVGHIVPALHRNGTIFWVRLDVHELPDESGRISLTSKVTIETSAGSEDDARAFVLRLNAPYQGGTDGPSGVGVDGSSGQIELLTGVHPDEILDLPLSKVLRSQTRTDGDLAEFLKTLCGPEEDVPWDIAPFLQAQFLRPDGTAVDVALGRVRAQDAFDPLAPTKLRVQVWVLQRLEGIIEIASDGTVTSASLGALITLGYHDDELVGESVNRIMPPAVARHHDSFLAEARGKRLVTSRRIVDALHRDGSLLRVVLEVSDADRNRPGNPAFVARICSRSAEQPTPLPPRVTEPLQSRETLSWVSGAGRLSSVEADRGFRNSQADRGARMGTESDGDRHKGGGAGAKAKEEHGAKADGSGPGTKTALWRRAENLPKLSSKPSKAPSAGQSLLDDPTSHDGHLPGAVNGPPASSHRSGRDSARDTKLMWVGLEPSGLQQRARRVSVSSMARQDDGPGPQRPRMSMMSSGAQSAAERPSGGSDAGSNDGVSRGRNLGSGVWSYNNAAAGDGEEHHEGGMSSPGASAPGVRPLQSAGLGEKRASNRVRHFQPGKSASVLTEGESALSARLEMARAHEPHDDDPGGPAHPPHSVWSLSDVSSDGGVGGRLGPSAGRSSVSGVHRRGKILAGPGGSGEHQRLVPGFLLDRFQEDALLAAEEYREHHQHNQKHNEPRAEAEADLGGGTGHVREAGASSGMEAGPGAQDKKPLYLATLGDDHGLSTSPERQDDGLRESILTPETVAEARAKRMRGILRLLNSPRMRAAISDLTKQSRVVFILCSGVYVTAIAVVNILIGEHIVKMQQIIDVCEAIISGVNCGAAARTLQQLSLMPVINQIGDETLEEQPVFLEDRPDRLIELLGPLYDAANAKGGAVAGLAPPSGQVAAAFQKEWDFSSFEVPADGSAGKYVTQRYTTFNGASLLAANSRGVASFYVASSVNLSSLADEPVFKFLIDNGPTAFTESFLGVQLAEKDEAVALLGRAAELQLTLLVVNVVVFVACILYFRYLLTRVAVERVSLYSVFLRAPKNVVLKLATGTVRVLADDSDDDSSDDNAGRDDDDDDDWTQKVLLEQQAKKATAASTAAQREEEGPRGPSQRQHPPHQSQHESQLARVPAGGANDDGITVTDVDGAKQDPSAPLSRLGVVFSDAQPNAGSGEAHTPLALPPPPGSKRGPLHPQIAAKAHTTTSAAANGNGSAGVAPANLVGPRTSFKTTVAAATEMRKVMKPHKRSLHLVGGAAAYHFLGPLIVWAISTVAGFAASYALLNDTISYVHQVRAAATTWQLAARVHYYAQELIAVPANSSEAAYDLAKADLWGVIQQLEETYEAVLYGDSSMGVESSLLVNVDRDHLLWLETSCIAKHCDAGPGHPWYPRVASGLDALVYFYAQSATRMLDMDPEELNTENPFFNFLWEMGAHDVNDGLERFTMLFNEDTQRNPATAQTILIAMFCGIIVANVLFVKYYFAPWTRRIVSESTRVAHLLSELPPEMNIDSLVLQSTGAGGGAAAAAAPN